MTMAVPCGARPGQLLFPTTYTYSLNSRATFRTTPLFTDEETETAKLKAHPRSRGSQRSTPAV